MSKNELKIKGVMEKSAVISKLEEILSAMKEGQVSIEDKEGIVILNPGEFMEMELKVKSKKEKEKIEIELSWRSDKEAEIKPLDFEVSSQRDYFEEEKIMTPAASAPTIEAGEEEKK